MKSRPYKFAGKLFRYDFVHSLVEWISKADATMIADEKEWREKYGHSLYDIDEDGFAVVDTIGLHVDNWKHKETRDEYLDEWVQEISFECVQMVRDFI